MSDVDVKTKSLDMSFYANKGECIDSCSIEELLKWQRFYESRFFNPKQSIKEKDVIERLQHYPKSSSTHYRRPWGRSQQYYSIYHQLLFKDHEKPESKTATAEDIEKNETDTEDECVNEANTIMRTRAYSALPQVLEKTDTGLSNERRSRTANGVRSWSAHLSERLKKSSQQSMLRKPLDNNVVPFVVSPSEAPELEGALIEGFRPYSYTTLEDPHPFSPRSFYNKNYPLLLQQIPRRGCRNKDDNVEEEDILDTQSLLLEKPRYSMTYFDNIDSHLTRELSYDEIEVEENEKTESVA